MIYVITWPKWCWHTRRITVRVDNKVKEVVSRGERVMRGHLIGRLLRYTHIFTYTTIRDSVQREWPHQWPHDWQKWLTLVLGWSKWTPCLFTATMHSPVTDGCEQFWERMAGDAVRRNQPIRDEMLKIHVPCSGDEKASRLCIARPTSDLRGKFRWPGHRNSQHDIKADKHNGQAAETTEARPIANEDMLTQKVCSLPMAKERPDGPMDTPWFRRTTNRNVATWRRFLLRRNEIPAIKWWRMVRCETLKWIPASGTSEETLYNVYTKPATIVVKRYGPPISHQRVWTIPTLRPSPLQCCPDTTV